MQNPAFVLTPGDRAPAVIGTRLDGSFYSNEAQAGRPVILVSFGRVEPASARNLTGAILQLDRALSTTGIDLVILTTMSAQDPLSQGDSSPVHRLLIRSFEETGLASLTVEAGAAVVTLNRDWRIVHVGALHPQTDIVKLVADLSPQLESETPQQRASSAPVLIVPNVLPRDICRRLIDHFEGAPHEPGLMASMRDGVAVAKLDELKKHRRDIELAVGSPLHSEILTVLARRCAPEMKRAFQFDVAFADRILLARYDDTGGYFKRHRDNAADHTAFREFAVSINLNTDEYEGGELLFPEFDDHRYSPPAGGAIIFSASLLHEAAAVRLGHRYVALSFLCSAAAQARMTPQPIEKV